ncbi:hypothetical protein [Embleya sp. AB8]|uniref:hypothetical protein n=1 Tax=Embleya sp. AB8 TaxID=3156304 RepID=UPI003C749E41
MSRPRNTRVASLVIALGAAGLTSIAGPAAAHEGPTADLGRVPSVVVRTELPVSSGSTPSFGGPRRPGIRVPGVGASPVVPCPVASRWLPATGQGRSATPGVAGRPDRPDIRVPGADPTRVDCQGLPDPGRPATPRAVPTGSAGGLVPHRQGSRRGATAHGKPPRRGRPGARERGGVAKQAVHDGPAVVARRAITDHVAGAGSGPVVPLGLAAGALVLVGGLLVAGTRRRRSRPGRARNRPE